MLMNESKDKTQAAKEAAESLVSQVLNAIPKTWQGATTELSTIVRSTLQDALLKMDVLTRDEFDAQKRVLERLSKKVEELESVIQKLEAQEKS